MNLPNIMKDEVVKELTDVLKDIKHQKSKQKIESENQIASESSKLLAIEQDHTTLTLIEPQRPNSCK